MVNKVFALVSLLFLVFVILALPLTLALLPSGATVNAGIPQSAPSDFPGTDGAYAGNITGIDLFGYTSTQAWQGYYGNVTGVIQLADANDNVLYNWSQTNPRGEVYASTNSTIYWVNVQCFNFTATGTYEDENGNGGTTNMHGTNLTQLQYSYNINSSDVDSVNNTFSLIGAASHDQFYTASQQFSPGQCQNTRVYDNTGGGVVEKFAEVLLYEPLSRSLVFTSLLNQDALGFDGNTHDFEMLVLDDGHGIDISTTTYYFFVELQ